METYFSLEVSMFLTLLAAAMWGSWMQIQKHLNGYPIAGVIFWLYTFSFILIWAITIVVSPLLLDRSIFSISMENIDTVIDILIGGGLMSLGLYCSLVVIGKVGLLLSTTISGGIGIILGVFTSIAEEGLPKDETALVLIIATTVILILAGFVCAFASRSRDKDHNVQNDSRTISIGVIILMLFTAILQNGWSMGTAAGTARGFAPVLTCAYMASGSFISVAIVTGIQFSVKKQWKVVFGVGQSKKPIIMSAIAALCHYGGNLMSIYSMPALSATVSFLFGKTANVWTIFWGIYYKEFSNISKKTKLLLCCGIGLYFVGVMLLGIYYLF